MECTGLLVGFKLHIRQLRLYMALCYILSHVADHIGFDLLIVDHRLTVIALVVSIAPCQSGVPPACQTVIIGSQLPL